MIRKLMASSAVVALISAGAVTMAQAQSNSTDAAKPAVEQAAAAQPPMDANSSTDSKKVLTPDQPTLASVFIGRSVYTGEGDDAQNIGDVNDLIVAENGEITDAVIGVGGFLGMGEKEVAVPFDQLKVEQTEGDIRLIYSATREQLEAAPAIDRTAYDPIARYNEQQAAAGNSAAPGVAPLAPATDMTAAPAPDQTAATTVAPADQTAAPAAPMANDQANIMPDASAASDQQFVQKAAVANEFEIQSSQLAVNSAQSQDVKDFAQRMIDDHTKAGEDLKTAVASSNADIKVPDDLDQANQDKLEQLKSASGSEFDQEYARLQVAAHDEAVKLFSGFADNAADSPIRTFAQNTLPTLEEHQKMIEGIASSKTAATEQPAAAGDASSANAPAGDMTATMEVPATQVTPAANGEDTASANSLANGANGAMFMSPAAQQIRATTLIGQSIYGPDDTTIGEVSDLVFEKEGNTRAALIDVGGFLGIGTKTVAIGFRDLRFAPVDDGTMKVAVAMSKDQLEQLPAFEPKAKVAATDPMNAPAAGDTAAPSGMAPATGAMSSDATMANNEPANPPAEATQPADQTAANDNAQPAVAGSAPDMVTTGSISGESGYSVATQDIPASSLIGASVYGPEDTSIGSIDDVVFDKDGQIDGVIVNVGGFLGLGAKPVAVTFDALNVRSDENGTLTVMLDASKDQLESAPTYDEKNAATLQ